MLAYLCLINNTTDDLRLRRIINVPARGIGGKTLETAERQAIAASIPLFDVIKDPEGYPSLDKASNKLKSFTSMILDLKTLSQTIPLPDFYDELVLRSGYIAMLDAKDTVENRARKENVLELKSSIISYVESAETPSLSGFLEEVSLYTDIEKYDQDADAAVMMTMHSAKGLEFPTVFLVGLEEGLFPGTRVLTEPEELEEERRLCYVAITRAKQKLYMSHARQRMLYGRTSFNRVSRFVGEIPEGCLDQRKKQQTQQRNSTYGSGYGYSGYSGYQRTGSYSQRNAVPKPKTAAPLLEIAKGDQVTHTAFGDGLVLSVFRMNGDALLEVAFDQVGTKKLMLKTASAHMKKK